MAKFKTGILGKISGSSGGSNFYHSKHGNIIRLKAIPAKTWSPAKDRVKNKMAYVSRSWAKVNPADVLKWKDFAKGMKHKDKLGDMIEYGYREIFMKVNMNLAEIGENIIFTPSKKIIPKTFYIEDIDFTNDDIFLFFDKPIEKNTKILVYASHPLKPGVNEPKKGLIKTIAILDDTFLSGFLITKEYQKVFPYVKTFKNVRIKFNFRAVSTISGLDAPKTSFFAFS